LLRLPKFSARDARLLSAVARWLPFRVVSIAPSGDPYWPSCELRIAGESIDVRGAPTTRFDEAPRPLGAIEHALWALDVARACKAAGVAAEVWPRTEPVPPPQGAIAIELVVGGQTVVAYVPPHLPARAVPERVPAWAARWMVDATVVVARCALAPTTLRVRDLVTVERCHELEIFGGVVALSSTLTEVISGYVPRVALADDAQVEVSVALGAVKLPLRDVLALSPGQIVQLGRPLSGPFEVRVDGRFIGRGELVDVDGELAVRIVSLEE